MEIQNTEQVKTPRFNKLKHFIISVTSSLAIISSAIIATPYISGEVNKNKHSVYEQLKNMEFNKVLSLNNSGLKWSLQGNPFKFAYTDPYSASPDVSRKRIQEIPPPSQQDRKFPIQESIDKFFQVPEVIAQDVEIARSRFRIYFRKDLFRKGREFNYKFDQNIFSEDEIKQRILSAKNVVVLFPGLGNATASVSSNIANDYIFNESSAVMIEVLLDNQKPHSYEDYSLTASNVASLSYLDYLKFAELYSTIGGANALRGKDLKLVGTSYGATQAIELANRLKTNGDVMVSNILLFSPLIEPAPTLRNPTSPFALTTHLWIFKALGSINWERFQPDLTVFNRIPTEIVAGDQDELVDFNMLASLPTKYTNVNLYTIHGGNHRLDNAPNPVEQRDRENDIRLELERFFYQR